MRMLLGIGALLSSVATGGCSSRPQPAPQPPVVPPPPVALAPPVASSAIASVTPSDPCLPLGTNEVSEDDAPSLAGATGKTNAGDWLEARGVKKAAFRSWIRAHDPANLEDLDADTLFDNDESCLTLAVGDKREDALLCTLMVRTSILRLSALAFVVRGKRIASVLEVGYALPAMDWPDARWLDLQLAFSADGMEADLHDRGKPGAVLVRAPRVCHEQFAQYLACEKAHRDGTRLDDVCPRTIDASGGTSFGHHTPMPPPSPMGGEGTVLVGCAEARPKLDELVKQSSPHDLYTAEFRGDRAFAVRSCSARGHYTWKGDRFVRAPAGHP